MTMNAPRAPIDFDAFERDLRQATLPQGEAAPAQPQQGRAGDPLAELARIVGQDDPFRALLETRQAQQGAGHGAGSAQTRHDGRIEPGFQDAPADRHGGQPSLTPADAFDQYLASVEQEPYGAQADAHDEARAEQDPAAFEETPRGYRALIAAQPRRKLVQVGAGLGVLMLCVTGALAWKSLGSHGANGPVTVLADKAPLKERPTSADGAEIPDQNKQIYDRAAKDDRIRIVNREEQPLDVAQAARSAGGREGSSSGTTPGNAALLTDSLGEPRRVRTVSVKPDTPVPARQEASADGSGRASVSPIPTMTMPDAAESTATPAAPRRPSRTLASTAATSPAPAPAPAPAPVQVAEAPPAAPAPAPRKAPQRVAGIGEAGMPAPESTASVGEPAPAPSATASIDGFSVQLGVRSSEADAHSAFKQMQGKYAQLSGKPELIRQAEVGGKSIYRVRVGPLAKAEATSLCSALKSAGGDCFVAKN